MGRPLTTEYPQVLGLLEKAFAPSMYESVLVKNLRDNDKICFDFAVEENGKITAYICYSTAYDDQKERIGYHLAPVAVVPDRQGRALG